MSDIFVTIVNNKIYSSKIKYQLTKNKWLGRVPFRDIHSNDTDVCIVDYNGKRYDLLSTLRSKLDNYNLDDTLEVLLDNPCMIEDLDEYTGLIPPEVTYKTLSDIKATLSTHIDDSCSEGEHSDFYVNTNIDKRLPVCNPYTNQAGILFINKLAYYTYTKDGNIYVPGKNKMLTTIPAVVGLKELRGMRRSVNIDMSMVSLSEETITITVPKSADEKGFVFSFMGSMHVFGEIDLVGYQITDTELTITLDLDTYGYIDLYNRLISPGFWADSPLSVTWAPEDIEQPPEYNNIPPILYKIIMDSFTFVTFTDNPIYVTYMDGFKKYYFT